MENDKIPLKDLCRKIDVPVSVHNGLYTVSVKDDTQLNYIIDELRKGKVLIQAVIPKKISLEDYFIDVIDDNKDIKN